MVFSYIMKTEIIRPSTEDSLSSFSLPSPEALTSSTVPAPLSAKSTFVGNLSNEVASLRITSSNNNNSLTHLNNNSLFSLNASRAELKSLQRRISTASGASSSTAPSGAVTSLGATLSSTTQHPISSNNISSSSISSIGSSSSSSSNNNNNNNAKSLVETSSSSGTLSVPVSTASSPAGASRVPTECSTSPKNPLQFTPEQIDCVCDTLLKAQDMEQLGRFLSLLPASFEIAPPSEIVLRAKASVAFARGAYKDVYNLLETNEFGPKHHSDLQTMWYKAHYKEAEKIRQRPLGQLTMVFVAKNYSLSYF